jgi:hypothetical protein
MPVVRQRAIEVCREGMVLHAQTAQFGIRTATELHRSGVKTTVRVSPMLDERSPPTSGSAIPVPMSRAAD